MTNRNILIDEKENSSEKNLRQQNLNGRSPLGPVVVVKDKAALRPALRTLTIHKQAQQAHQQQQKQVGPIKQTNCAESLNYGFVLLVDWKV